MLESRWPSFSEEEIHKVVEVLHSGKVNYWTGEEGRKFETEFAAFCQTKYAVALSNGTVALEAALDAIGLPPGTEVIVTPRTFFASASAIVRSGLIPVFADVDPDTQCITAQSIESVASSGTGAVLCVHLGGHPCNMPEIVALARSRNWYVIEDCAQAHGARYDGTPVGSLADISCWSFCQDKIMTTGGEGGMITTSNEQLYDRVWSYKDHGKTLKSVYEVAHPPGFRWLHDRFGTNGRMTEMQAAIGRIQLTKLDHWVERRRHLAERIRTAGRDHSCIRIPQDDSLAYNACYRCYLFWVPEGARPNWHKERLKDEISRLGVPCQDGSCPTVNREKAFLGTQYRAESLPVAQKLGETSLAFLVHPTITDQEMDSIVASLNTVFSEASI